jgi:hypothetical protein
MNEYEATARRVRIICRALSILALAEGGLGVLLTMWVVKMGPLYAVRLQTLWADRFPHNWVVYAVGFISLPFNVMLLVAGGFLWKRQRKGLLLLTCVLIAELTFGLAPAIINVTYGRAQAFSNVQAFLVGIALFPFFPQILTVFPLIAGILIFFAYRYLGIPAHST